LQLKIKCLSLHHVKQLNTLSKMKTIDLLYQNEKELKELQELLLNTTKHVEFLAAHAPEIRNNLEAIAESLQMYVGVVLEKQIVFNRDICNKFAKEVARKNQAYDFIAAEKLVWKFKTFCEFYPTDLYRVLMGDETLHGK